MLRINFKKLIFGALLALAVSAIVVPASSILFATDAEAVVGGIGGGQRLPNNATSFSGTTTMNGSSTDISYAGANNPTSTTTKDKKSGAMFGALISAGTQIFVGLRDIIFAAAGIGIVAVAIGGFFGNLNWKWLAAIGIGLFVLSTTAALIEYMVGTQPGGITDVQGSLKSGK